MYWMKMRTVAFANFVAFFIMVGLPTADGASSLFEKAKRYPLKTLQILEKLLQQEDAAYEDVGQDFKNYEISACNYTDEVLNKYRPHMYMVGLQEVARHDLYLAKDFAKSGYPESIWRPALTAFTKANARVLQRQLRSGGSLDYYYIKTLMRRHERAFVRKLETYRRMSGLDLQQFHSSRYCGGDYIGFFNIRTVPPGGHLQIIREFFFQLCLAETKDPYSAKCDMWMTPSAKAEFPQGTYRYRVKWTDSLEECGKSDFLLKESGDYVLSASIERTNKACEKERTR